MTISTEESTAEVVGNAAVVHMAAELAFKKHTEAIESGEEINNRWWYLYMDAVDRFIAMQLDITERMVAEGVTTIDTGRVQARLETVERIPHFVAVLYRDGKPLTATVEERA